MDSWSKFEEDKLPNIDDFYSKLNMLGISDDDYEHAKRVWGEFGLRNSGEYHDLYLKTDVILLSNVFAKFRKVCMENYGLDPAHFYAAPGLAWHKVVKRYMKANNKYMNNYDRKEPSGYLHYLDANNLYGWVMSQPLPTGGFKWVYVGPGEVKELSVRED